MLGNPKFKVGDRVRFEIAINDEFKTEVEGTVGIVDAYGTFFQNEEPSYDIMVENFLGGEEAVFVKHIPESDILK